MSAASGTGQQRAPADERAALPGVWATSDIKGFERSLTNACIHCGYCLSVCPTYVLWRDETDSPRGRIVLARAALDGDVATDSTFVRHFDQCLACLACETACPSGVDYGHLIELMRGQIEELHHRSLLARAERSLLFMIFPHPGRLRVVAAVLALFGPLLRLAERSGLLRLLPRRLSIWVLLAPRVGLRDLRRGAPKVLEPGGTPRYRVGLLTGCVQRALYGEANAATARVLAAEGCEVVAPGDQGCCGALAVHAGRPQEARQRAREIIAVFERAAVDRVVVNAAGCGSSLKDYGHLLAADPEWAGRGAAFSTKVRDVMEFVAELGEPRATRHDIGGRVVYQDACHLLHAQGIAEPPRAILAQIPGLEVVDIDEAGMCCGSGGVYNLLQPKPAEQLGRRKAHQIDLASAELVLSPNPGCRVQLEAMARVTGAGWKVVHPIEVLDASIRAQVVH